MVNMKDKLETLAARYDEIQVRLSQPETLSDMDTWRRLMKEHADMEELMTAYGRYKTVLENVEQAKEMLEDPDLRDMAKEELSELELEQEALERELQLLLLPKDPNDDRNVIVEIRAGTGGEEAALFASELGENVYPLCRRTRLENRRAGRKSHGAGRREGAFDDDFGQGRVFPPEI